MNKEIFSSINLSIKEQEKILASKLLRQEDKRVVYWGRFDPFLQSRLQWRASMARHLFHILPGQRILEVGAGGGEFTQALMKVTRNECPITSVVFSQKYVREIQERTKEGNVEARYAEEFPGDLPKGEFDYVVGHAMLEDETRNLFLSKIRALLKPGGGLLLFEPNPWNPYFRIRKMLRRLLPIQWRRPAESISLDRLQIFSVLSEIGYTHINALPYDFLYAPIPKCLLWQAKNLSLILENCPFIRNFAGSLYIWARNGEIKKRGLTPFLCEHEMFFEKVSFVVPCHNEEMVIAPLIERLRNFYGQYIMEIIIVDDNSTDNTAMIAREFSNEDQGIRLIKRKPPNGVGRALREGLAAAQGEYVVIMDADFQDILPEMRDLFDAMAQGADVAIGSRFSRESVLLNYPFTKIMANRMFHLLANFLLKRSFRDMSNNLKIMKREVVQKIHIESDDFAANAETGLKPLLMGYDVREVPISWINRSINMGLSSFKLMKTGPNYVRFLMRLVKEGKEKRFD